jgi:hypothetical protein
MIAGLRHSRQAGRTEATMIDEYAAADVTLSEAFQLLTRDTT